MEAKLTPADIRQQRFRVSFRGFNIQEVESFLGQVAETLDLVRQENEAVRAELQRLQAELSEFKKREQLLKDTLINAQKVIESMKANAQKEAEIIIHDAELKAEKILQDSYTRQGRIKNEIECTVYGFWCFEFEYCAWELFWFVFYIVYFSCDSIKI